MIYKKRYKETLTYQCRQIRKAGRNVGIQFRKALKLDKFVEYLNERLK